MSIYAPLVSAIRYQEFKHESFALFDEFGHRLRTEIAQDLFRFEIITPSVEDIEKIMARLQLERSRSFVPENEAIAGEGVRSTKIGG